MSIIKNRDVQNGLVNFIQRFSPTGTGYVSLDIGISTMLGSDGTGLQTSVIRDVVKGTRPDFPYIVVDQKTSDREDDSWLRNISVENDKPLYR